MDQLSIFDVLNPTFHIDKHIRLIELFGGIGSQAMALRNIGADFEHYKLVDMFFTEGALEEFMTETSKVIVKWLCEERKVTK